VGIGGRLVVIFGLDTRSDNAPRSPWVSRDRIEAATIAAVPMIGFVAPAADAPTLTGETIATSEVDLTARFLWNGQPHRRCP
jgi:2-methylaconitate cis-trans-isomerase PrpF